MSEGERQKNQRLLKSYKELALRKKGEELLAVLPQGEGSNLDADMVDGMHAEQIIAETLERIGFPKKGRPTFGAGGMTVHGNELHSPNFEEFGLSLLLDGSRPMTGNLNLGGNKLVGDSVSGGDLILESTSHATKGKIIFDESRMEGLGDMIPGAYNTYVLGSSWGIDTLKTMGSIGILTQNVYFRGGTGGLYTWTGNTFWFSLYSYDTAYRECLKLINGEAQIPRAGDIDFVLATNRLSWPTDDPVERLFIDVDDINWRFLFRSTDGFFYDVECYGLYAEDVHFTTAGATVQSKAEANAEISFRSFLGAGNRESLRLKNGVTFIPWCEEILGSKDGAFLRGYSNVLAHYLFQSYDGAANKDCIDLVGGYADIPRAGDIIFIGDKGLAIGEIYANNNAVGTVLAAQDTWYQITIFDTDGIENNADADHTNDHIIIEEAGRYLVTAHICSSSAANNIFHFAAFKNNGTVQFLNLEAMRHTTIANKPASSSISGYIDVAVDDTIELWVKRTDGGAVAKTVTISHVSLAVTMVGG